MAVCPCRAVKESCLYNLEVGNLLELGNSPLGKKCSVLSWKPHSISRERLSILCLVLLISQAAGTATHLVTCQRAEPHLTARGHSWLELTHSEHRQEIPKWPGSKGCCRSLCIKDLLQTRNTKILQQLLTDLNQTTSSGKSLFVFSLALLSAKAKLFAQNLAVVSPVID